MKNIKLAFELLLFPIIFLFQSVGMRFFRIREGGYRYHLTPMVAFAFFAFVGHTVLYAGVVDDSYTTQSGVSITKNVMDNDTGNSRCNAPRTQFVSFTSQPGNGIFTDNGNGSFTYTPNPNYQGTETFYYTMKYKYKRGKRCRWSREKTGKVTIEVTAPTPPTIDVPDQTAIVNQSFSLDLSNYTSEPNGDTITYSVDTLPDGLSLDSSTGIISGTPTKTGTYTVTATAKDKDGSDSDTFTITVNELTIVENADDICYEDLSYDAMPPFGFCVNFGIFKGGINCQQNIPLKNQDPNFDLTDVQVALDTSLLSGNFFGGCGIDDGEGGETCQENQIIDFGPVGMFGKNITYNLNSITVGDTDTIWEYALMDMALFQGNNLYAKYKKNGKLYRGRVKKCTVQHQGYRPFTLRYQNIFRGKMITVGNTILVAPSNQNGGVCSHYTNGPYIDDATTTNDNYFLCAYHNDTSVNFPTTSATIPIDNPDEIEIAWAGLYWQALVNNDVDVTSMQIKIKHNDEEYHTIGYDQLDWKDGDGHQGYISYSAFKDITDLFKNNGWKNGTITVGDIPVYEGKVPSLGTYGAWTLVIVYKDPHEKARIFSIYDGWHIVNVNNQAIDITTSGFLTPKSRPIQSSVSVFTAEGDKHIEGDYLQAKPTDSSNWTTLSHTSGQTFYSDINVTPPFDRVPDPTNNQGIDIQSFNLGDGGYDIMEPDQTSMDFEFGTDHDTYWPSMIAFETELITPKFCYDYSYRQGSRYFTESEINATRGPWLVGHVIPHKPIEVSLYIRNDEKSDITAADLTINIKDINTTQAKYIRGTTFITPPNAIEKQKIDDINVSDDHISNIPIGTVDAQEYFYTYYQLDPGVNFMNMPISGDLKYTLKIKRGSNTITLENYQTSLRDLNACIMEKTSYTPTKGIFNVVEQDIYDNGNKYNITTQVAGRFGKYEVVSFDPDHLDTERNTSTQYPVPLAIDIVDMSAFHDLNASCFEPTNKISGRIWLLFDGNITKLPFNKNTIDGNMTEGLTSPEDFLANARRNAAFRVSYIMDDNHTMMQVERLNNNRFKLVNFPDIADKACKVDMDGNPNSTDMASTYCGNNGEGVGNNGMTSGELHRCLQCIYGYNTAMLCSRDNFSIRPAAFHIQINDDRTIIDNNDTSSPTTLASGYPYKMEINATRYQSVATAKGYIRFYETQTSDHNISVSWAPNSSPLSCPNTNAIDLSPFAIYEGRKIAIGQESNLSSPDVGRYQLRMIDKSWTMVDQNPPHHRDNPSHFLPYDCQVNSNAVLPESATIDANHMNGCEIRSSYAGPAPAHIVLHDLNLTFVPYAFDLNLSRSVRPSYSTSSNWLYDSNVTSDPEMAYHITGTITAVGKDNTPNSNFVRGCYAKPISLTLDHNISSLQSAFEYRLFDIDGSGIIYDHTVEMNASIDSGHLSEGNFTGDINGTTRIALHYNFRRSTKHPLEPTVVTFKDFNVTCQNWSDCASYAEGDANHSTRGMDTNNNQVFYYYARMQAPDYKTKKNSISAQIYAEIYCNENNVTCSDYNLSGYVVSDLNESVDDVHWWINPLHTSSDGNITNLTPYIGFSSTLDGAITISPSSISTFDNGVAQTTVTYTGSSRPHKSHILIGTQSWLKSHRFITDESKIPYFNTTFLGTGSWAGIGRLGQTVKSDNNGTSERIDW